MFQIVNEFIGGMIDMVIFKSKVKFLIIFGHRGTQSLNENRRDKILCETLFYSVELCDQ